MKLHEHSEISKPSQSIDSSVTKTTRRIGDWTENELASSLLHRVGSGGARYVARAPGTLDVFGGISDYVGSPVLVMPLTGHAIAALRPTGDGMLRVSGVDDREICLPMADLVVQAKLPSGSQKLLQELVELGAAGERLTAIGTVFECVRAGWLSVEAAGIKLAVGTNLSKITDCGESAAVAAATLATLLRWADKELSAEDAVHLVQAVDTHWLSRPVGPVDAMCSLQSDACLITQMNTIDSEVAGTLAVPKDCVLIAIDTGVTRDPDLVKYSAVRVAAQMGAYLIGRIIEFENRNGYQWDGWLAQLPVSEFAERFRDRLPTRMKGSEFLERFGETNDTLLKIEPSCVYRVRSRTEHHVYESSRTVQFVQALLRADQSGGDEALLEAGDSMYASHWSYGQRCGLGSVETDLLVKLLRDQGQDSDVFGAKLTGRGAGGVVIVLARDTERAHASVARCTEIYQDKIGIEPAILSLGDTAGVIRAGVKLL